MDREKRHLIKKFGFDGLADLIWEYFTQKTFVDDLQSTLSRIKRTNEYRAKFIERISKWSAKRLNLLNKRINSKIFYEANEEHLLGQLSLELEPWMFSKIYENQMQERLDLNLAAQIFHGEHDEDMLKQLELEIESWTFSDLYKDEIIELHSLIKKRIRLKKRIKKELIEEKEELQKDKQRFFWTSRMINNGILTAINRESSWLNLEELNAALKNYTFPWWSEYPPEIVSEFSGPEYDVKEAQELLIRHFNGAIEVDGVVTGL